MERPVKVLVACEYSGRVRDAFRALGHDAISCDLLPTDVPGPHVQGDVLDMLREPWDLVIAHPPCTYLCNSGVRWLVDNPERWVLMHEAATFFRACLGANAPRICVENPVMHRHARLLVGRGASQTIQPYEHGHPESKRTGLWLRGLPTLVPTKLLARPMGGWLNQTPTGQNKLGPSAKRAHLRSLTYLGVAHAMAQHWGDL